MKTLLVMILTIALCVIIYYNCRVYKEKHALKKTVGRILSIGGVIVMFNIMQLCTDSPLWARFALSGYYVSSDWLLLFLLIFSFEYIGKELSKYVKKKLIIFMIAIDTVSLTLNTFTKHAFDVKKAFVAGESMYCLDVTPYFALHYVLVMVLAVACLVSLFYGAVKAPMFYRHKYLLISIILLLLVALNVIFFNSPIDISVLGYVVGGICIYYCAFVYTPQRLLPQTLFRVAEDMNVGLLLLDMEGNRLYNNRLGQQMLSEEWALVDERGCSLEHWCKEQYINGTKEFTEDCSFYKRGKERVLRIQLQRLKDVHNQLQGGYFVIDDRTEEIKQQAQERYMSNHDALTGFYNKEYFYENAKRFIRNNEQSELYMVCTDVKDFKMINDFFGTEVGDVVLKNIAHFIETNVGQNTVYGRIGNDVFAVLMPRAYYTESLFDNMRQEDYFASMDIEVSFPVVNYMGVYEVKKRDLPISVMCDRARMAITKIKGGYHRRVAYYDEMIRDDILREKRLIGDLREAIDEGHLQMYLQPQVSADGTMLGAEALVRWIHPEKGMVMPGDFIPVFERNGLISEVDKYIWECACQRLRKWKDEGREDVYISVNISPKDFYFMDIYQIFTALVRKYEIEPKNIKLEITETAIVIDIKRQMELIGKLQQAGFVVEMDDFGSGHSSLNMLKDIDVDVLKIDMAFLAKARDEERSKKILEMVVLLSKQLSMPVIMEGVETESQVKFLSAIGCDMFQGYYFARPMEVAKFEEQYMR
ncbi:MAG: EAL domain-containing protein [Lachnospiraceae bacterium]|nr:EAL domain-containing protein [Lachnospiraceae bacterium]